MRTGLIHGFSDSLDAILTALEGTEATASMLSLDTARGALIWDDWLDSYAHAMRMHRTG